MWNLLVPWEGEELEGEVRAVHFQEQLWAGGLADLGSAGPDQRAEGGRGKELAGEPHLTHAAPRKWEVSRVAVSGWAVGVQPSLRYAACSRGPLCRLLPWERVLCVCPLLRSVKLPGQIGSCHWETQMGFSSYPSLPTPPPKTKKQPPV